MALAQQQRVQTALESESLRVHRLGNQQTLGQSPTLQAAKGLGFLDVSDKDILRLTRPRGTYQKLMDRFNSRYGEALGGKVVFITAENLPEAQYPVPLRKMVDVRLDEDTLKDIFSSAAEGKASWYGFGHVHGGQQSVIVSSPPTGNVGSRMVGLADEIEPYAMSITHSKTLRSRSGFMGAEMAHELGHHVYAAKKFAPAEVDVPHAEAYATHIEECFADAMSVHIMAQMSGEKGLDYVQHDRNLRALSLQNDVKYYTCPSMDGAIEQARSLLESGDLEQMDLDELAEAVHAKWQQTRPDYDQFIQLHEAQRAFEAELEATGYDMAQVTHPLRAVVEKAWDDIADEFETPVSDNRQDTLKAYYNEVAQSLRGYGSRSQQQAALQACENELREEEDLNQQLLGRDDLTLDELEDGELLISERRAVLERIGRVISQEVEYER